MGSAFLTQNTYSPRNSYLLSCRSRPAAPQHVLQLVEVLHKGERLRHKALCVDVAHRRHAQPQSHVTVPHTVRVGRPVPEETFHIRHCQSVQLLMTRQLENFHDCFCCCFCFLHEHTAWQQLFSFVALRHTDLVTPSLFCVNEG